MISYKPLFKRMKECQGTTYSLIHKHGINPRTVNNIKNGRGITTYTLGRLCHILNCTPNDIIEFIDDDH